MGDLDLLVLKAKTDHQLLENLIKQHEYFILKYASRLTHRYITKSDDEWSIALLAFHQAIDSYEPEKGNFQAFYELVIKRRLIDYMKSQGKYNSEVSIDPVLFDTGPEDVVEDISIRNAVSREVSKQDSGELKLEITSANDVFSTYGFSFMDLTKCSPHAKKSKAACAKAINFLLQNPMLVHELQSSKLLPIKVIEKNAKVPRKIMERHRKYIIAAIVILSGEYPNLAEYLRFIREENVL